MDSVENIKEKCVEALGTELLVHDDNWTQFFVWEFLVHVSFRESLYVARYIIQCWNNVMQKIVNHFYAEILLFVSRGWLKVCLLWCSLLKTNKLFALPMYLFTFHGIVKKLMLILLPGLFYNIFQMRKT